MWRHFIKKRTNITSNRLFLVPACSIAFSSRMATNNKKTNVSSITVIKKEFQEKAFNLSNTIFKQEKKSKKILTYFFSILGLTITVIGTYTILEYGFPIEDQPEIPFWKKHWFKISKQFEALSLFIKEPSREKLLPDPLPYPYYQPPYTLVLEFTDVMAHPDWTYRTGWRFKKRPGLDYMLENLVGLYEIVVYTAEPGMTIFPVLEAIDQKHLISYKLVRDSTHFIDGHHIKNLDRLNRNLKKVIVIDWDSESVKFHPDNQFSLPRWEGNDDDMTLIHLTAFLKTIAVTEIEDVREVLRYYKQFGNPLEEFRSKQREYLEKKDQISLKRPANSIKKVFDFII